KSAPLVSLTPGRRRRRRALRKELVARVDGEVGTPRSHHVRGLDVLASAHATDEANADLGQCELAVGGELLAELRELVLGAFHVADLREENGVLCLELGERRADDGPDNPVRIPRER